MHTFYFILFSVSLQISRISSANDKPESSTKTITTLPLMAIWRRNLVYKPTKLESVSWLNDGVFGGATTFSGKSEDKVNFLCPEKEAIHEAVIETTKVVYNSENYCLFPTTFRQSEALHCAYEPEPVIDEMAGTESPCDYGKRSKMYQFHYQLCFTEKLIENEKLSQPEFSRSDNPIISRKPFLIYQFCFDEDAEEIIYTSHEIFSPDLLADVKLDNERRKTYGIMKKAYALMRSHYETIMEPNIKFHNIIEEAQQLVPADDMALALWRKPTYHLLNMKPMRETVKSLWNHINELIRLNAMQPNQHHKKRYQIYTRTLTAAANRNNEEQQPDLWLKVIQYTYTTSVRGSNTHEYVAILLDNNFGDASNGTFAKRICNVNLCEGAFSKKFPHVAESIRCCPVSKTIKEFFKIENTIEHTLDVDFLYKNLE